MKRAILALLVFGGVVALGAPARQSGTAEALLGRAMHQEEAEGNLEAAIASYKKFLAEYGKNNRRLAAQAQYHLGLAYEKLGNAEAQKAYERVVRDYADQPELAADARRRLAALGGVRAAGTLTARRVLTHNDGAVGAHVTPDGRFMAMTDWDSGGDLAVRDMSTGRIRRLMAKTGSGPDFVDSPVLSPDQRQVAYVWNGSGELRVMPNEPGGKPKTLIRNPEFSYVTPADWSPDGKSVLTILWKRDGTSQIGWVAVADGAIKTLSSPERRGVGGPVLSPDGRHIAYAAIERSGTAERHIYVLAADGSGETDLVRNARGPVWTPDSTHILYTSDRSGSLGLWAIRVRDGKAAGAPMLVKADIGQISPIGLTRSGSYYYMHQYSDQNVFIAEVDPATARLRGPAVQLTEKFAGSNRTPSWSPDGKRIAFKRRNAKADPGGTTGYDLVVRSLETGEEKSYPNNLSMGAAQRPQWFPDGQSILVDMIPSKGGTAFFRLDLRTGEYKEIAAADPADTRSALSGDGRTLYTTYRNKDDDPTRITAMDITTGRQKSAFTVPGGVMSLALSPDGSTLALMQREVRDRGREVFLARVAVDGSGYRELYRAKFLVALLVAWTRDGRGILFQDPTQKEPRLMRMPAEGGPAVFTGLAIGNRHSVDLSPDGSRLAFSNGQFTVREIWALDNVLPALKAER